jgi:hypothetical protein
MIFRNVWSITTLFIVGEDFGQDTFYGSKLLTSLCQAMPDL